MAGNGDLHMEIADQRRRAVRQIRTAEPKLAGESTDLGHLLARVADRDRTAFRALYNLTSSRLFAIVLRLVRSRPTAEEILQDVYLRIWVRANSYVPAAGDPLHWMIAVARYRSVDSLRERRLATRTCDDDGSDLLERLADDSDPEAQFSDTDGLRKCLSRLDAEPRSCILLAYCYGFSREELAVQFNRPVNTIKTWLHRGLASLKSCLDAP